MKKTQIKLTQAAYLSDDGLTYQASARDITYDIDSGDSGDGIDYTVYWNITNPKADEPEDQCDWDTYTVEHYADGDVTDEVELDQNLNQETVVQDNMKVTDKVKLIKSTIQEKLEAKLIKKAFEFWEDQYVKYYITRDDENIKNLLKDAWEKENFDLDEYCGWGKDDFNWAEINNSDYRNMVTYAEEDYIDKLEKGRARRLINEVGTRVFNTDECKLETKEAIIYHHLTPNYNYKIIAEVVNCSKEIFETATYDKRAKLNLDDYLLTDFKLFKNITEEEIETAVTKIWSYSSNDKITELHWGDKIYRRPVDGDTK